MLRRTIVLFALLASACGSIRPSRVDLPTVAYPWSRAILQRNDVSSCADRILSLGWYGMVDWERAAFLRIGERGLFTCEVWPSKLQFRTAHWSGPIPEGTAAVIHSHPRNLPNPSEGDIMEAHRLGIPVIVVTPEAVTMVVPSDGRLVSVPYDGARAARLH